MTAPRAGSCFAGLAACVLGALLAGCASPQSARDARGGTTAAAANMQLGSAYLQQGNLPIAKEKLERAAAQSPRDPQVRGLLALLYSRMGEDARAEDSFREALRYAPADPDLLNNYAVFLCSHGRADEGVKRFEQSAANPLYRTPWAAYANAGVCLRGAKRSAEAGARFERALQARPDYAEALVQLADLDFSEGRSDRALARVQAFLGRNQPTPDVLLLGWRAALAEHDKVTAAQLAWRLQTEFADSEQARSMANGAANSQANGQPGGQPGAGRP
jgi:type IV pilus assembly protein PilF